jgi:hypothetical protein
VALEALITNEKKGGATNIFKKRLSWLSSLCGFEITIKELDQIYDLRSRLAHGDMVLEYYKIGDQLLYKVHQMISGILKYLILHPDSLRYFISNDDPTESLKNIRTFFSIADSGC